MPSHHSPVSRAVDARERGFRRISAITAGLTMVSVVGTGIVAAAARAATTAGRAHALSRTNSTGSTGSTGSTDDGGTALTPDDGSSQGNVAPAPAQAPPQVTSAGS